MAATKHIGIVPAPYVADVDLSATCALYRFVRISGSAAGSFNKVLLGNGASNPAALGVIQNSPSSGQEAAVVTLGYTKLVGRATTCILTFGRYIMCASDGVAEPPVTSNGSPVCGRWEGENITTQGTSNIGVAFLFGFTTCHVSPS